jgi:hypothetical protein
VTAAFWHRDVTQPIGSLHRQPTCGEFDVAPLERQNLAQPQACVAAQQHHQVRVGSTSARGGQQPLVLIEVAETHRLLWIGQQLDHARQSLELAPLDRLLQQPAQ